MLEIQEDAVLRRRSSLLESEIDGEVVALEVTKGQCYGFDAIATHVWKLLENETSLSKICEELAAQYDVDDATCKSDVRKLLSELHSEGLLAIDGR